MMAEASSRKGGAVHPAGEPGKSEVAELLHTFQELRATTLELRAQNEALARARQALEAERQRYQDLFDFAPDGYLVTDREGVIQQANCAAGDLLRVPRQELVGQPLAAFVHGADRALLLEQMALLAGGTEPATRVEVRLQPRQGAAFDAALKVAAAQGQEQPARLQWLIRDISERKRVESDQERLLAEVERQRDTVETLAHTLARDWNTLQAIMENTATCLAYLDRELHLQRFNLAFAQKWGTDESELLECSSFQMSPGRRNSEIFREVCERGQTMSFRARPCARPGEEGSAMSHWDCTLAPVKDGTGKVQGLVLSLLDVTEEVRAVEVQTAAQEALHRQNEELVALTRELNAFAHTVAHDLKQPLTIVMGFADMLHEEMGGALDDSQKKMLQGIKQGARRMSNIVEGLLLLASTRSSEIQPGPLDMGGVVREVRQNLAAVIEEAGAELVIPSTWPVCLGYGPWVESVWANYLTNAIKYGGRPPRVELGGEVLPGGYCRFWVQDNGQGLSRGEQARLFTSFTRLGQPRTLGHGLGLTIVRRIVERLGGQVGVESEPGQGCTFWFTLPT